MGHVCGPKRADADGCAVADERAGADESPCFCCCAACHQCSKEARLCLIFSREFGIILTTRMWASDFAFKADLFAREYGDVNPGIPFWPEGGDTANLSASLRLPFQAHLFYTLVDAVCGHLCQPSVTLRVSGRSQS